MRQKVVRTVPKLHGKHIEQSQKLQWKLEFNAEIRHPELEF